MCSNFKYQKKVCDLFKFKEKRMLEEIDLLNVARAANLEELVVLRTDSRKTKDQLVDSNKALGYMTTKYKALFKNSLEKQKDLNQKLWEC